MAALVGACLKGRKDAAEYQTQLFIPITLHAWTSCALLSSKRGNVGLWLHWRDTLT